MKWILFEKKKLTLFVVDTGQEYVRIEHGEKKKRN